MGSGISLHFLLIAAQAQGLRRHQKLLLRKVLHATEAKMLRSWCARCAVCVFGEARKLRNRHAMRVLDACGH